MLNNMLDRLPRAVAALACLMTLTLANGAKAQDADPPGRVARVNLIEGQASVQLAGDTDWTTDVINRPLTTGDKVWVDNSSRAEMHIGSLGVRMGAQTGVELLNVTDQVVQLRLSAGSMSVRVRNLQGDESVEVDTPNVSVALTRAGEFRFDVNDNGDITSVAVINGEADVSSPQDHYRLEPRERGEFRGADTVVADVGDVSGPDSLDLWAEQRDAREDRAVSAQYVSRDVPGYSDLDDNGSWSDDPTYGPVWAPRVAYGWAPYQTGHWVWISPWGWTWVDDAPWGFAPFHYGRWVNVDNRWCWSPGRRGPRPVYAPALVAWVGGGAVSLGISVGGGRGGVGWFPLGYNEVYRPAYRVSNAYVRNVNVTNTYITNTTIINNTTVINNVRYVNQNVPGAVAAVSRDNFVSARPVGRNLIHVDQRMLRGAGPSTTAIAIAPTERSRIREPRESARNVPVARPAADIFARPIVTRRAPPPPAASFEAQRQAVISNGARPVPMQAIPRAAAAPTAPVRIVQPNVRRPPVMERNVPMSPSPSPSASPSSAPAPAPAPSRNDRPPGAERPFDRRTAPPMPNPRPDSQLQQREQMQQREQQAQQLRDQAQQREQLQQREQQQQQQRAEMQQREMQQQRAEIQQRAEVQQRAEMQRREQAAQQQRAESQQRSAPPPRAEPPRTQAPPQPRAEPAQPPPRQRAERGDNDRR